MGCIVHHISKFPWSYPLNCERYCGLTTVTKDNLAGRESSFSSLTSLKNIILNTNSKLYKHI